MDSGRGAATESHEGCWEQLGRDRKGGKIEATSSQPLTDSSKTFPNRTEGSVKKHWYKVRSSGTCVRRGRLTALQDMHYADFAEDDVSFANTMPLR